MLNLNPRRVELATTRSDGTVDQHSASLPAAGEAVELGDLSISCDLTEGLSWSILNKSSVPLLVRSVALVFDVAGGVGELRMFRNGYQSWSPTGVATFGVDVDPSTIADFEFMQATHHADQHRALDGELRSEWLTLLADAAPGSPPLLIGFDSGSEHDGTLRLRAGSAGPELWAEAFLGDVTLAAGEQRQLHDLLIDTTDRTAGDKLAEWASRVGELGQARVDAPYQVGWCSWYQYFHAITEADLRHNLALADDWPFDVFQLDDGYQAAIGDWLTTNDKFPSSLAELASAITDTGRVAGIWLAPFLVAPDSQVATEHPDWVARYLNDDRSDNGPLRAWWNEPWGGGDAGFMYGLDTTNPAVLDHMERLAAEIVAAGFTYLKLDFTFSPSHDGGYFDPSRTPAQRVRAGFEAIRRGAGDEVFILGCGVPLSNVVGLVDANRIGQDVAPLWTITPGAETVAGYRMVEPATQFALANTMTRAFMHRRLWLNDPDCLMLRASDTELSAEAARTWAQAVGVSGGMALVSDDLALLDDAARNLLDETLALGRASDSAARAGRVAECGDLLAALLPTRFSSADHELLIDPATGESSLVRPDWTVSGAKPREVVLP